MAAYMFGSICSAWIVPPPTWIVASALCCELLHRQNAVDVGHMVEVALDLGELGADVVAQGFRDLDVMARDAQLHGSLLPLVIVTCSASAHSMMRIFIASRYLATVRRATVTPPSDSICAI